MLRNTRIVETSQYRRKWYQCFGTQAMQVSSRDKPCSRVSFRGTLLHISWELKDRCSGCHRTHLHPTVSRGGKLACFFLPFRSASAIWAAVSSRSDPFFSEIDDSFCTEYTVSLLVLTGWLPSPNFTRWIGSDSAMLWCFRNSSRWPQQSAKCLGVERE